MTLGNTTKLLGAVMAVGMMTTACTSSAAEAPGDVDPLSPEGLSAEIENATPATVRVRSASRSLPMLAGAAKGFFAAENLNVDYSQFASSKPTFIQVSNHEIEVIISSTDNAVNYQINPNNAAGAILDVQIIFAHDNGLGLALVALPGFTTAESLRGKRIGVDVQGSGFALPVAKIMRTHGMEVDVDYTMVSAGGSPARLAGLLSNPPQWEAAIINAESIVKAKDLGLPVIGTIADIVSPYAGGSAASSRFWLHNNPGVAARFTRAFARATNWVQDPRNRAEATALLVDADTTPAQAVEVYNLNVASIGLSDCAGLSHAGFLNLLSLRNEFKGFEKPQNLNFLASPASGLYDLRYYQAAIAGQRGCTPFPP